MGHSSNVQLLLMAAGQSHRLAEIGPGYVTFREAPNLKAGSAEVVMRVDGQESRWSVNLQDDVVAQPFDMLSIS
jgi:hypothetical protein